MNIVYINTNNEHHVPFVCSSLYFDEDGDLAHEFYEETVVTKNGRKRAKFKRIQKNLIPQVTANSYILLKPEP